MHRRLKQLRKLLQLISTKAFRCGLRHGTAAAVEHRALLKNIPLMTLIDVGANTGQFSLLIRTLHPDARIYAFEPLSRPAEKFERLFRDDPNCTLFRCAIGHEAAVSPMYVSGRDDSSSLLPITDEQVRFAPGTATVGTEQVTVRRLDEVLATTDVAGPSLLKLDVQGYELCTLHGCGSILQEVDFVYAEVSFVTLYLGQALAQEVIQFLYTHCFSLAAVNNPAFDTSGRCIQADFLFKRRLGVTPPSHQQAAR